MTGLLETLRSRVVVGDGGMGTMLQAEGLQVGRAPDLLNLERGDLVASVHARYREAGCDYLETNTFGANRIKLAAQGLDDKLGEIILRGVDLARSAAGSDCLVAGSVGPTGNLLEPYGDTPLDRVASAFAEVAEVMEKGGVDFYLVETMTDIAEAVAAISAIRAASSKPVVATAVFAGGPRGYRTIMGTPAAEAATRMVAAGADLVGTNCCSGMTEAAAILEAMRPASTAVEVAQPNAGLPRLDRGNLVYPESPEAMAAGVPRLLELGARVIGGCCGTTPAHIRAIVRAVGRA